MSESRPPTNDDAHTPDPAAKPPVHLTATVRVGSNDGGTVTGVGIEHVAGDTTIYAPGRDQRTTTTGGGDYAEHTIDKRQGTFNTYNYGDLRPIPSDPAVLTAAEQRLAALHSTRSPRSLRCHPARACP